MSGGSWGYAYEHVEAWADRCGRSPDPVRRAFANHLEMAAAALHDIEWVDSADKRAGDEHGRAATPGEALALAEAAS